MKSTDFLTHREVIRDCIRLAAIPSLAVAVIGCIAWAVSAAFGAPSDEEPAFALVLPFALSAIYGNVVIHNIRWKHQVRLFQPWWFRLSGIALVWSGVCVVLSIGAERLLMVAGVLDREPREWGDNLIFVSVALAFSVLVSLLPPRQQVSV